MQIPNPILAFISVGILTLGQGYIMPYDWKTASGRWHVVVAVVANEVEVRVTAVAKVDGKESWRSGVAIEPGYSSDYSYNDVASTAFPLADGNRLLVVHMPIPDWSQTVLWPCTEWAEEPVSLVLRYRDDPRNVIVFKRSKGTVHSIIFFDRWVGGPPATAWKMGSRLDRWEKVTTYVFEDGKPKQSEAHYRLIRNGGGGVNEKLFVVRKRT